MLFNAVRLYDINTLNCYVSSDARDQHTQGVTSVSEREHSSEPVHAAVPSTVATVICVDPLLL